MRSRIVIPAAILVTAAYIKGRLDAHLLSEAERATPIPVVTPEDAIARAEAEAADAMAVAEAQAAATTTPPDRPRSFTAHPFRPQVFARPAGEDRGPAARPPAEEAPAEWWTAGEAEPVAEEPVAVEPVAEEPVADEPVVAAAVAEVPRMRWAVADWPSFESSWIAGPPRPPRVLEPAERAVLAEWLVTPAAAPAPAPVAPEELAVMCEWVASVAAAPAEEPVAEGPVAEEPGVAPAERPAPAPEVIVDEDGRFSLGGWAAEAGHMALCGVTFRDRRGAPVNASAIRLVPDAVTNVADGGLVVLWDDGFEPDAEGFTVLVAAAGPGGFAASGRYEVIGSA